MTLFQEWKLANDLAGNSGLWIGYTMLSFIELVLIGIQSFLYVFGFPELPEVPSCLKLWEDDEESEEESEDDASVDGGDAAGPSNGGSLEASVAPPKNFPNSIGEEGKNHREKNMAF